MFETISQIKDLNLIELNKFWHKLGFNGEIPKDFTEIITKFGCCQVILENSEDSLKYIQIGAPSQASLIDGLNANIKYLKKPAFIFGINGMGQSLVYTIVNDKFGVYSIYDSELDSNELKYLAPTLLELIDKKQNLKYLE